MELIKSIQDKKFSDIKDYCTEKVKSIATNLIETRKNAYLESLKSQISEKHYEDDEDESVDDGEKDEKGEKDEENDDKE